MKFLKKKSYLADFSLALLGYILLVFFDTLNKKLTGSYQVSQIVFVNTFSALIPIFLFTQIKNGWAKLKKANLKVHFLRAGFMFVATMCFITSLGHLPLVIMYSIVFTAPLILTIGANLFLNEKVGWRRYTAIIVGFLGVIISLDPFNETLNKYVFIAFISPLAVSISWLILRKYGQKESIYSFLIYGKIFMIIFSGIFLFNNFVSMNLNDLLINFCSGFIRGLALICIFSAARNLPSSLFAPTQFIQIFAAAIIGYLIFGDIPTFNNYVGNIFIIGAGIYIIMRELTLSKKIVTSVAKPINIPIKNVK
jgi:drug/metabolite transporter (DMT)-like permease